MEIYIVYNMDEEGSFKYVDSYWRSYENAVIRFKEIWPFCREPDASEIRYYIKVVKTAD